MRTAKEWMDDQSPAWRDECGQVPELNQAIIRQVQADALQTASEIAKETTFAAGKKTWWEDAYDKGCLDAAEAILAKVKELENGGDVK